jgi:hypothetical protein
MAERRPVMTASAVLRVGAHAPVPLHGTPAVSADVRPGEITIILGYDSHGQAVTLAVTSLEWDDDLLDAALDAAARGIVRSGMTRTAPAPAEAVQP